ncbi:GAF domain-containing sensor histidine kinase [Arenibacterium halophilum]|uniref:histidine kinase n=1 Tax=Arenibacterium halophilum TaxID=2583821 RepID=A0ABY2XCX5_9RHOB|nr:GAF domain-containing sensor histidine kinase [Arenibacterium halophilum]TMV13685.1 GAF domain-containing sensor histidine kinase [Arenibacterium halophilum]
MLSENDPILESVRQVEVVSDITMILEACGTATGMGFVAVARVTEDRWMTCASHDQVNFGLTPGDELDVASTICCEVRAGRNIITIPDVENSNIYRDHPTPRRYGFQSYISVPIIRSDDSIWGTLCALDPAPREIDAEAEQLFTIFARLIARELDRQDEITMGRQEISAGRASLQTERDTARLREEFIAIVGHDLRNPIAAVTSGLRMLEKPNRSPEHRAMLVLEMQRALTRASQIITNLMDFARGRLGAGIEVNAPAPINLAPIFRDVIGEIEQVASQPVHSSIDLPRALVADPQRLGQLLSNLLGNAVAHGDPNQPIIVDISERDDELVASVTNQGTPIPPDVQASLFQPFSRNENKQKSLRGLGLGLYIASQIALAHRGQIDVSSSEEAGTTFTLRMPANPA